MDQRESMNRLDKVRKNLKSNDDLDVPMSDDFFNRLHDKIMSEVDKTEMAPPPVLMRPRNMLRAHWRGWLYPTGGLMSVVFATAILVPHFSKVTQDMQRAGLLSDGRERIVMEAVLSPEDLSQTLISSQTDSDFFVDVARESSENFKVAKLNLIVGGRATR